MGIELDEFDCAVITSIIERWQAARLAQSQALHNNNQRKLIEAGVFMDIEAKAMMRYLSDLYMEQTMSREIPDIDKNNTDTN